MSAAGSYSQRRRNALTGQWVLVSPHRTLRPWLGQQEKPSSPKRPPYEPSCYLCPGNVRAEGRHNPSYQGTFIFLNDFPALTPATELIVPKHELLRAEGLSGECRVMCYSPRHDLSLGELAPGDVVGVVRSWRTQFGELDARADLAYTLVFENRGEMMGASSAHPHGQIWSTSLLPDEVQRELAEQQAYGKLHGRPLLVDYLQAELATGERVVRLNAHWAALVPYWAVWPFELLLLPRRPLASFTDLSAAEEESLAEMLRAVTSTYDRLFDVPFPYSMGWHPRPSDGDAHEEWVLHAHFFPPLLRSASVRKFQVGFEMLGMPQRDLTPEVAAERLRTLADA